MKEGEEGVERRRREKGRVRTGRGDYQLKIKIHQLLLP
jgi:hypothetical protein